MEAGTADGRLLPIPMAQKGVGDQPPAMDGVLLSTGSDPLSLIPREDTALHGVSTHNHQGQPTFRGCCMGIVRHGIQVPGRCTTLFGLGSRRYCPLQ